MKKKLSAPQLLVLVVTALFLLGYIVYPLLQLLVVARPALATGNLVAQKQVLAACLNSVLLSLASVVGSAVIGTFFAYLFRFPKVWCGRALSTLVLLPIAIPPITGVMAYLFLLGDNGLLMKVLGGKNLSFTGWKAILTIHWYSFYPLFYLFTSNALRAMDNSMVEAAHALGGSKGNVFFRIMLPQLRPALLGASLLTFMASMASFSAPFLFAGAERFLTTEIYYAKINGDPSLAALLSLLLTALSLGTLLLFRHYSKSIPAVGSNKGTVKKAKPLLYKKGGKGATVVAFVLCALIVLPVLSLLLISLAPENFMMQENLHFSLSLHNYRTLFGAGHFLQPFLNSMASSMVAVLLAVVTGLTIAGFIRKRVFGHAFFEAVSSIPYSVPGTVIAIGLILSFNHPSFLTINNILVGSFWILPVAYTIRNLPIVTQAVKSALYAVDRSVEEASGTLGASGFRTWRSITLPLIFPSIAEGSLLVFINSFGEFVATILLYNASSKTTAIEIYSHIRLYNNGMAATYGVLLFFVVFGFVFMVRALLPISK